MTKKKTPSSVQSIIKIALVDDLPLAIEGWKQALQNEVDIEVVMEITPSQLFKKNKYPLLVDAILIQASSLTTAPGIKWLRTVNGLDFRPKIIAMAKNKAEILRVKKVGVDEASLDLITRDDLVNLIRGTLLDDKRASYFFSVRLAEYSASKHKSKILFEDLMHGILKFLFRHDLMNPRIVYRNNTTRDLIFLNESKQGFWGTMKIEYGVDYVPFFLDNQGSKFSPYLLGELSDYLDGHFGRMGFVITSNVSINEIQGSQIAIYKNSQKIILVLDISRIRKMLSYKAAHIDPLEVLQELYDELIESSLYLK